MNKELKGLHQELQFLQQESPLDAFCSYMYVGMGLWSVGVAPYGLVSSHGVVLKAMGRDDAATSALVNSVNQFPWNWSAWEALAELCTDRTTVMFVWLAHHA